MVKDVYLGKGQVRRNSSAGYKVAWDLVTDEYPYCALFYAIAIWLINYDTVCKLIAAPSDSGLC
jgi:hypothetical protein